jgi:hypothetical protein
MHDYVPTYKMLPIHNIIKGNLVQHSNEHLCSNMINDLSLQITEAIESFFKEAIRKDTNS